MRAMIFAAGLGTRLRPLTDRMPKALVPILGKPLLLWQIERLKDAGITRIIVNVHHKADQIIQYLRDNRNFDCDIRISDERDCLLETGGGLKKALISFPADEPILALNADILSTINLPRLIASYSNDTALLVVSERQTQRYLSFDQNLQLRGWINTATGQVRPQGQDLSGTRLLAFSGMQILAPRIINFLNQIPAEKFSLIDLYMHLVEQNVDVKAYIPNDYRMIDVGKIEQLAQVEQWANEWLT